MSDDPLWRHPLKRAAMAVAYVALCMAVGALLLQSWLGALLGAVLATIALADSARVLPRAFERLGMALRWLRWHREEGRHHAFAGVSLEVCEDSLGRWIHERGLRELLGLQRDSAEVLKARFAGQWRQAAELGQRGGGLWLRAEAVVAHLASAPDRMDPKRLRLRRYLERDVIAPAQRRRDVPTR